MRLLLRPLPPGSLAHAGTVTLAMEGGRHQLCAFVGDGDEVPGDISFEFDEGRDYFPGELVGIEGTRGYFQEVTDMAPSGDGGTMGREGPLLPPVTKGLQPGEEPSPPREFPVQEDDGTCPADYPAHEQVIEARVSPDVLYPEHPSLADAQDAKVAEHATQDPGMQEQIFALGEENARLRAELERRGNEVPVLTLAEQKEIDEKRLEMAREIVAGQKLKTLAEAKRFAENWIATAAQHAANEDYCRGERDKLQSALTHATASNLSRDTQAKNLQKRIAELDVENRDLRTANMHLQNTSAVESFLRRLAVASDNKVFAVVASLARRGALLDEVVDLVDELVPKETRMVLEARPRDERTDPYEPDADSDSDDWRHG